MPHANSLRKPGLIFFAAFLMTGMFNASLSQPANYEAAKWSTWFLDNPQQITVAAPPLTQSKAELQTIRQRLSKIDEKKLREIKYWDAGAPSLRWNQIATKMISWDRFDIIARNPSAWMNTAIYDATILAWKEKIKYKRKRPHDVDPSLKPVINGPITYSYPCEHSVTAAAAATVLAYFYPEKADSILQIARAASQTRIDAGLQFPSDVEAGWKLGEEVGKKIIEKAKNDGSTIVWDGKKNTDPKKWTGPFPLGITLAKYTPMVLSSPEQFRPAAPPDFESEMKELKNFKKNSNTTYIAYYWANTGYGLWNDLASEKMFEYRIADDAPAAARIYAILNMASHDAAISVMDAKYAYWGIRPVQYDSTYKSLLQTPPFPGYPSGHAMGTSASAAVLSYFFPADAKQFEKMAKECADSRFYAGIHFRTDNEVGTQMGKEVGQYIVETLMKK
jgi:membrane-associated phospholipid phosphatase